MAGDEERVIEASILTIVSTKYPDGMPPDVQKNLNDLLKQRKAAKAALRKAQKEYAKALAAFIQAQLRLVLR